MTIIKTFANFTGEKKSLIERHAPISKKFHMRCKHNERAGRALCVDKVSVSSSADLLSNIKVNRQKRRLIRDNSIIERFKSEFIKYQHRRRRAECMRCFQSASLSAAFCLGRASVHLSVTLWRQLFFLIPATVLDQRYEYFNPTHTWRIIFPHERPPTLSQLLLRTLFTKKFFHSKTKKKQQNWRYKYVLRMPDDTFVPIGISIFSIVLFLIFVVFTIVCLVFLLFV